MSENREYSSAAMSNIIQDVASETVTKHTPKAKASAVLTFKHSRVVHSRRGHKELTFL